MLWRTIHPKFSGEPKAVPLWHFCKEPSSPCFKSVEMFWQCHRFLFLAWGRASHADTKRNVWHGGGGGRCPEDNASQEEHLTASCRSSVVIQWVSIIIWLTISLFSITAEELRSPQGCWRLDDGSIDCWDFIFIGVNHVWSHEGIFLSMKEA